MQTDNAIRTLKSMGFTVASHTQPRSGATQYWTNTYRGKVLSWWDQDGQTGRFHTQRESEQADSQTDYFPGSYWNNLKAALTYGLGVGAKA